MKSATSERPWQTQKKESLLRMTNHLSSPVGNPTEIARLRAQIAELEQRLQMDAQRYSDYESVCNLPLIAAQANGKHSLGQCVEVAIEKIAKMEREQAEAQIAARDLQIADLCEDMRIMARVAGQASVENQVGTVSEAHATFADYCTRWADRLDAVLASLPAAPVSTPDDEGCAPVDTLPTESDGISAQSAPEQLQAMSVLGKKHAASARAEMRVCGCPYRLESVGEMVVCPHCFDREQRALLLETAYGKPTEEQIERRIEVVKDRLRHESAQADPAVAGTVDEGTSPQCAPQSSSSVLLGDLAGEPR